MARGRRRRPLFRKGRLTDWISGNQGEQEVPLTNVNAPVWYEVINLNDLDEHDDRFTVVRMVGEVYFQQRVTATDDILFISWGFFFTTSDSAAQIIGLNPGSQADADSEDWMFRRTIGLSAGKDSPVVGGIMLNDYDSAHFDVKVMRKMEGMHQIALGAVVSDSNMASLNVVPVIHMRTLVKLA